MKRTATLHFNLDRSSQVPLKGQFPADPLRHNISAYQKQLKVSFDGHYCITIADGSLHCVLRKTFCRSLVVNGG